MIRPRSYGFIPGALALAGLLVLGLSLSFAAEPTAPAVAASAAPVVPGFERLLADPAKKPGLDDEDEDEPKPDPKKVQLESGYVLLGELNCVSCHQPSKELKTAIFNKQAPLLDAVGSRVTVEFLRDFLARPHVVKPGTTMPALFAGLTDAERARQVEPLVHFLSATGTLQQSAPDGPSATRGEALFHQVGCVACHGSLREGAKPFTTAVPLGNLVAKYSLGSMVDFLRDPLKVRPSGRMPHLNLEEKDARDIANFLLRGIKVQPNMKYAYYEGDFATVPDFTAMKPKKTGTVAGFDLGAASRKNNYGMRFEGFLQIPKEGDYRFHLGSDDGSRHVIDEKQVVLNDGVHPFGFKDGVAKLTAGTHSISVDFTQGGGEWELALEVEGAGLSRQPAAGLITLTREPAAPSTEGKSPKFVFDPDLAKQGKELFVKVGCAACHTLKDNNKPIASTLDARPFAELASGNGCLSATPPDNVPHYDLSAPQRDALNAVVAVKNPAPLEAPQAIARTLSAFNCQACHERDKRGGPAVAIDDLFQGTIKEMGDEGRIPPHLNAIGDKLNSKYLAQVLNNGAKDRPYMLTRMPRFGGGNVGHLTAAFEKVDQKTLSQAELPDEPIFRVKSTGRILVGEKGFSCVKCHNFSPHKATGIQAIDLTTMTSRLREDWFLRYMINPQRYRPGTRMPTAFPNGVSIVPNTYGGKPTQQLSALWAYLEDGKNASIPGGIIPEAIELVPKTEPIVYRNFIQGLNPRGIAVGFPEKVHYAYDADGFNLALIWHNQFIDASKHWVGRGPGFQTPLGDHVVPLTKGRPFVVLASGDTPWPSDAAKERGYLFKGYRLDDARRPIFRYTADIAEGARISVEDAIAPLPNKPDAGLDRTLILSSDKPIENLWYRAATGASIEAEDDGTYVVSKVLRMRLKSNAGSPVIRKIGDQYELLVPLTFENNKAQVSQTYVW